MAFSISGLYQIGPGGNSPRSWSYSSTDTEATVLGASYFDSVYDQLSEGDIIYGYDSTNEVFYTLHVTDISASDVVTVVSASGGSVSSITADATVTLTAADSGKTYLLNKADGIVFTLPAPVVGLKFKFLVGTAVTSNAYSVDTDAASTFLLGNVVTGIDDAATTETSVADGTATVSLDMNGTTKGGLIGSYCEVECISATQWMVSGLLIGSGTLVSPFA